MRQKMKLLHSLLLLIGVILAGNINAQTKTVSGKITDKNGTPISAASVQIKGKSIGVMADDRGYFSISTKSGDVLVISAVNYVIQEIRVDEKTNYKITLESNDAALNEVVVTALGIKRNINTLPYSAQQVSGAEVNKTPTLNPVANLSGKISGLLITQANTLGGSTNVIIRGIKSLTQSNQALFVVDGVPYDNTNQSQKSYDLGNVASDLNPDNIESISVLKSAAASALYGARASNGVIMITTKKGGKKNGIGVTATFGVTYGKPDNSTLPTYQTEYGQGAGSAGGSPNYNGFFYNAPTSFSNGQNVNIVVTDNDAAVGPAYDPSLMVYNWDAFMPGDPNFGKATPWKPAAHHKPQDYFQTVWTTTSGVNVAGNTDKGYYNLSYIHDDNKDFMPNSSIKKNLIDFSTSYKLFEKLSIGASIQYSDISAVNRSLYPYTGGTSPMTDFRQWWPTNVDLKQLKADYFNAVPGTRTNATWNWQTSAYMGNVPGKIGKPAYHDNPYWFAYQNPEADSRVRYFGNVHLDYTINSFLTATARVSKDYYTQFLETKNDVGSQTLPFYFRYDGKYDETNYDLMFNLNKDLSKDINLKAVAGYNARQTVSQNTSASTSGGLVVPGYFALANSVNLVSPPAEYYGRKDVVGLYAGATLGYQDLLTLDGTLRRDVSSSLPKGNNTYYYPSVSLNFQFGKLLKNQSWLSHGKAWINYAEVTSDAPIFSTLNTYNILPPINGQTETTTPYTNNNPKLIPEKQKQWETGIEAGFLRDRISFTATYYHINQSNQIMPISVSTSTGYSTFFVNGGAIQNTGVELSLNVVPIRSSTFNWDVTFNWSKNNQKVLSLYNNQPLYVVGSYQNSLRLVAKPGKSYQLQGTDYTYLNGQRVINANGNYVLNSNQYSDLGTPFADWMGGINNSFRYKNLSLSFLIDMRKGGKVYSLDMDYGSGSGLYPRTAGKNDLGNPVRSPLTNDSKSGGIILKGVHADGTPNTTRIDESDINTGAWSFSSAYGEADKEFVYDAGYIKLREVNITYSFPSNLFSKFAPVIKGVDFSLAGRNLWIIHKNLPYADPEQGQASGNASMGFQNGAYPTIRAISAILKVRF